MATNPTYVPTDPGLTRGYLCPRTQLAGREGTLATGPGDTPERLDRKPQEETECAHIVGKSEPVPGCLRSRAICNKGQMQWI